MNAPESSSRPATLYNPGMAIGNTLLGSPIAGCILLAHNLANLGRVRAARYVMIVGALATSIALGISYVLWRTFMHPPIWYGMMTANYSIEMIRTATI
jgi:hypothetical protein